MPVWTNQETGEEVEADHPNDFRNQIEEANRRAKEAEKWKAKHEPIVEQHLASERIGAITSTFGEKGLTERAARLFSKTEPNKDPSEEAIAAFAAEYPPEEFPQFYAQAEPETKPTQTKPGGGFTFSPTVPDGPPQPKSMTREEYEAWRDREPGEAIAFRTSGGVIKD